MSSNNFTFNNVPVLRHSRSRFDLSHGVKTSGNVGTLYPFEVQEVYPGDTFKVKTSCVCRLTAQFLRPVMDNLFLDVYWFYVPSRLLYDKFPNVFGENTESAWANTQEYKVPLMEREDVTMPSRSVGDYLGLPVGNEITNYSVLPFRAFAKVYDDWFRDENNVPPMHIQNGVWNSVSEEPNNNDWSPNNYFGKCPKVAKLHDYFTSALPAPQKGAATDITLTGNAPVSVNYPTTPIEVGNELRPMNGYPLFGSLVASGGLPTPGEGVLHSSADGMYASGTLADVSSYLNYSNLVAPGKVLSGSADLSSISSVSVNDLRFAFQYQRMLERDARGGSRYTEFIQSHFNVSAGDVRLQRSEFLGGRRSPISIHQVVQTTGSGSDSSPLGEVGAYSLSNSKSRFTKGFVEHGYVIGVFCIRQFHTYQQGIEKFWSRSKRSEFYDPVFASIGEQPIFKKELYADGSPNDDSVFGYAEAWADLRNRPNKVTGQMRSGIVDSLDVWHFADYYGSAPTLNSQFIQETPQFVDRAISAESGALDQFILDFWISNIAYRPLPTYSVPGLIDHH